MTLDSYATDANGVTQPKCCGGKCISKFHSQHAKNAVSRTIDAGKDALKVGSVAHYKSLLSFSERALGHCSLIIGDEPATMDDVHYYRANKCLNFNGFYYPRGVSYKHQNPVSSHFDWDRSWELGLPRLMDSVFSRCSVRLAFYNTRLTGAMAAFVSSKIDSVGYYRWLWASMQEIVEEARLVVLETKAQLELYVELNKKCTQSHNCNKACKKRLEALPVLDFGRPDKKMRIAPVKWNDAFQKGFPTDLVRQFLGKRVYRMDEVKAIQISCDSQDQAHESAGNWSSDVQTTIAQSHIPVPDALADDDCLPEYMHKLLQSFREYSDAMKVLSANERRYDFHIPGQTCTCLDTVSDDKYNRQYDSYKYHVDGLQLTLNMYDKLMMAN